MAKRLQTVFLEEWLRSNSGRIRKGKEEETSSNARAIIQAWAELRDAHQHQNFATHNLQSLKTLLHSKTSLYVADPQAKLLISILSSPNNPLPHESYPLFFRLLYVWIRKSSKPSSALVDSAAEVLSHLFSSQSVAWRTSLFICEGALLLGALTCAPTVSESSKGVCLALLCVVLEKEYRFIGSLEEFIPNVLAGIGYALSSSKSDYLMRIFGSLVGMWGKEGGPCACVSNGLMILHLLEWVLSAFINSNSFEKIEGLAGIFVASNKNYAPFALLMAAGGVLRASSRASFGGQRMEVISRLRTAGEEIIEAVASNLISKTKTLVNSDNDPSSSLHLQCVSIALSRCGPVSSRPPLLICLASALLTETFPFRRFYSRILEHAHGSQLGSNEVKEHLDSVIFREAGAATSVFCTQYALVDVENKAMVESLLWTYCQDIYNWHRKVAFMLGGRDNELLADLEKIAESAFLMVVVFALAVTKHRVTANVSQDTKIEASVNILASFSCVEYFRRMRLTEYMDTIRAVVVSVQENESACVSFLNSMPSYTDLLGQQGLSCFQKKQYVWCNDDVQTARILFYLRVIPTVIERLPVMMVRQAVAPIMFLYMGHVNAKVARASHSVFVAFISSGKDSDQVERELLKEQLVFYYVQRSLEGYPGITPFDGMASGVAALVRHLPAGSPAIYYCIHSLVKRANEICKDSSSREVDLWKNWQGDSEPCKKVIELLLRLTALVDIQVLPNLMKWLAELIIQLPKDGQTLVLNELYAEVAESDDVIRKPSLVSWLQSLSYLSSKGGYAAASGETENGQKYDSAGSENSVMMHEVSRL